ncbi:MAG: helix-turn-helix domain-containing protein [Streptococcaceae bacterium]|jgi:hypothetical protein|nr:helix-turn-helix domain-containing protein [Streptococcaceae bacterium]
MLLFLIDQKIKKLDHNKTQQLLDNSLTYQLLKELLIKKSITSTIFCNKYYLSYATFQRRKKKLNILLDHFSISFSKKSLQGEEKNVRWFLIHFFQSIASFNLLKIFFTLEEWNFFKKCKQTLIKNLNHNLNKCFEIWLLAIFFHSLGKKAQTNFEKSHRISTDFEIKAFHLVFSFLSASDLQFLILGYHLFHPEQSKKISQKIPIHPEAKIFVKNLNKSLPTRLINEDQKNLTIELTYFVHLHQYLPIKFKSFVVKPYLDTFYKKYPNKANFHYLLQKKSVNNTNILKNSFAQNSYTRYFLNQLIDNILLKMKLPIYFDFYSDFDPYIQKNLKIKICSISPQLVRAKTNDSVDLTIYQSEHMYNNRASIFCFPLFVTEKNWLNFTKYIEKLYYQKLTDYFLEKEKK